MTGMHKSVHRLLSFIILGLTFAQVAQKYWGHPLADLRQASNKNPGSYAA